MKAMLFALLFLAILLLMGCGDNNERTEAIAAEEEVIEAEVEPAEEEKELTGRRKELEEMKDKDFYADPMLKHLGWAKEEIVEAYGEPDMAYEHYIGGEEMYYSEKNVIFVLAGEEGFVNNLFLLPEAEVLGVEIGMTLQEIRGLIGAEPRVDISYGEFHGEYILVYFLGNKTDSLGELELWFRSETEEGPTFTVSALWKKYWEPSLR